jgi:hypothetical protein
VQHGERLTRCLSEYYRNEVQRRLGPSVQLTKPDESTAKAVASGSLVWLIDGVVSSRVSRLDYGIKCATVYKPEKAAHAARRAQVYSGVDGTQHLSGAFGCVLRKGTSGRDDEEHISPFVLTWIQGVPCTANISLFVYRGEEEHPEVSSAEPSVYCRRMADARAAQFVDEAGFEQLATFIIECVAQRGARSASSRADACTPSMEPFRPLLKLCKSSDGGEYIRAGAYAAFLLLCPRLG